MWRRRPPRKKRPPRSRRPRRPGRTPRRAAPSDPRSWPARGVTKRQLSRLEQLKGEGGATESDIDRLEGEAERLERQIAALAAQTRAARGRATAARERTEAARARAKAAVAAIRAAEAEVERARVLIDECALTAPLSGYVLTRAREPGEVVLPGATVLDLVRTDPVETIFYVPNAELARVDIGQKVRLRADAYRDRVFEGEIVHISPEAEFTPRNVQTREDRDRLVYAVKVGAPNPDSALRPGMPVEVTVPATEGDRALSSEGRP